ncbi:hypothetical protein [Corynebacterium freiburgense]|uniref:hypothetical protein n=1 Tax=Corynebacterium freiburgense TaxID=556548 RepID=UPI000424F14F|nr:hypothetical protein [Corynebacterium freiburgense]WJZ03910.1 hypothetical protein CFREI_13280 [Corynebacterium freiburgense]
MNLNECIAADSAIGIGGPTIFGWRVIQLLSDDPDLNPGELSPAERISWENLKNHAAHLSRGLPLDETLEIHASMDPGFDVLNNAREILLDAPHQAIEKAEQALVSHTKDPVGLRLAAHQLIAAGYMNIGNWEAAHEHLMMALEDADLPILLGQLYALLTQVALMRYDSDAFIFRHHGLAVLDPYPLAPARRYLEDLE